MTTFNAISRVRSQSRAKNAARLVLLNLATRADANDICYPSVTLQQKDTLLGRSTIVLAIQHLEAIGELYAYHCHGKKTHYLIAVGLAVDDIAVRLRAQDEFEISEQEIRAAIKRIADCRVKADAELAKVQTSSDFGLVQNSSETSSESGSKLVQNLAPNYHIEESYNYQKTLATAETSVEAQPENLLASQEPAQPTKQADAPMPESKDPTPQVPPPPSPRKRGKSDKPRKEPERGPLYRAVHEVLLGITDPGDGKHMISRINTLRRIILDAEGIDRPTAEQDERLADGLRTQFGKWYRREFQKKYNKPAGPLPAGTDTLPVWYGAFAQARKDYEARQAAEVVKPTPAQADPGCPHCGGTGKVSIYKSANDKWAPMRYGELVPAGVTETASATCRCILTKGA